MTTVVMDRNPYEQQYSDRHGPPMASGVVSNSDENRFHMQQEMKHQMQREYNDHMAQPDNYYNAPPRSDRRTSSHGASPQTSPRRPVYYRMGTPERGLPLGSYEDQRRVLDEERQKDYNRLLTKKEQAHIQPRQPTPPGGLPISTEEERQRNAREKQRIYGQELQKQKEEQLLNRAQHQLEIPVIDRSHQGMPNMNYTNGPPSPQRHSEDYSRRQQEAYIPSAYDSNAVPRSPYRRNSSRDSHHHHHHHHHHQHSEPERTDGYALPLDSYKPNPTKKYQKEEQRRQYNEYLKNQNQESEKRKIQRHENSLKPMAQPKLGNYYNADKHDEYLHTLQEQRKREYQEHVAKLREENAKKEQRQKEMEAARKAHEERDRESPPIIPRGDSISSRRLKLYMDIKKDYKNYLATQPEKKMTKDFWHKGEEPKIYPIDGEYDGRRSKLNKELREDFTKFMDKKETPRERRKVFGEQGGVLFDPMYPSIKEDLKQSLKKEWKEHLEVSVSPTKRRNDVPRQHADPALDSRTMFSDMGVSYDQQRKKLSEKRNAEYNDYIRKDSWYSDRQGGSDRNFQEPQHGRFNGQPQESFRPSDGGQHYGEQRHDY